MEKERLDDKLILCEREEATLLFRTFNYENAWELGNILIATAKERNAKVALNIIINGYEVFRYCFEGTGPYNSLWLERKNRMVHLKKISTLRAGYQLEWNHLDLENDWLLNPIEYSIKGGGFPILIEGIGCIGSVSCSGLPHEQDHKLVVDSIEKYLKIYHK